MYITPRQLQQDMAKPAPGSSPTFFPCRRGATFLALALTRLPTKAEHMRLTDSGYNIAQFALIKPMNKGYAAAPYRTLDPAARQDQAKVQLNMRHNKDGKPITELLPENPDSRWPAVMRMIPFKKEGTYDKGERNEGLAAELCLSNILSCYVNAETFSTANDPARADTWKLPFDSDEPIEPFTLCELEVVPKNTAEATKGKCCRIARVRRHTLTLNTYREWLDASRYPASYEESILVQLLCRIRSPSIRSDVDIARQTFYIRDVNPNAVVYNPMCDGATNLLHIVNWADAQTSDTDGALSRFPEDTRALVTANGSAVTTFINQHAYRYNRDTSDLDPEMRVDLQLEECAPENMPIDIPIGPARTLLNCETTEGLTRLLQLAAHTSALRLFVVRDPFWATGRAGTSCFRAIPLIDTAALLRPLTALPVEIPLMQSVTETADLLHAASAVAEDTTTYAICAADAPHTLVCARSTEPRAHECIPALADTLYVVCADHTHPAPAPSTGRTVDCVTQIPTAASAPTLCTSTTAPTSHPTNITYAPRTYTIHILDATRAIYTVVQYTPDGNARDARHAAALGAGFDPANAVAVGTALLNAPQEMPMRARLLELHAAHRAAARALPAPAYLTISTGVCPASASEASSEAEDAPASQSPAKRPRRGRGV